MGAWLSREVLPLRNGLVHLPSAVAGQDCLIPPTPTYFCPYALEFDYDPAAPSPEAWLRFLESIWGTDQESIDTLQEWFGYCLTADTRQQKILAIMGPRRSGKGTIARVLEALLGKENVAAPTLAGLGTNFGLGPLISKPLAIISDARLSRRSDQAITVERLLSISGEDYLTIDRKYREAWTGQLPTRLMLLTNELPRLRDDSNALAGRLIMLVMRKSFYGNEDLTLKDRLMTELPGILNWAIAGWARLEKNGRFRQPESGREHVKQLEVLSSPVQAFLLECCVVEPTASARIDDVYAQWQNWCTEKGYKHPGDVHSFGRTLWAAVPELQLLQPRVEGKRPRFYRGIGLQQDRPVEFEVLP